MSAKHYCGECNQLLMNTMSRCTCGWQAEKTTMPDHRCQYTSNGRRCPLLGTMCPYPYGNGPWYCSGHWSCMNDPKLSDAVLLDAEINYQTILAKMYDESRQLISALVQKPLPTDARAEEKKMMSRHSIKPNPFQEE